jgi:hypothetical protein
VPHLQQRRHTTQCHRSSLQASCRGLLLLLVLVLVLLLLPPSTAAAADACARRRRGSCCVRLVHALLNIEGVRSQGPLLLLPLWRRQHCRRELLALRQQLLLVAGQRGEGANAGPAHVPAVQQLQHDAVAARVAVACKHQVIQHARVEDWGCGSVWVWRVWSGGLEFWRVGAKGSKWWERAAPPTQTDTRAQHTCAAHVGWSK